MKNILIGLLALVSISSYADECTINTSELHRNQTAGTQRVESILKAKGYNIQAEATAESNFKLNIAYYGNDVAKSIDLQVEVINSRQILFYQRADYKTPYGIEGGFLERRQVIKLAKQIPFCK